MNYKKLLIVTPTAPDQDTTFIRSQIDNLHPFSVLHSGFRPFINEGKSIFHFPFNIELLRVAVKRLLPVLYDKLYTRTLSDFLSTNKYDLVLCNFGPQASNVYPSCLLSNIPLIAHFHGYDASLYSVLAEYKNKYAKMFEKIAAIISVSNDMTIELTKLGADKDRIHTIPYGVNLDLFSKTHPEKNAKKLIFAGRFTEKKAPDILLKAFNKALQKSPESQLVMVGRGELGKLVLSIIQELNIGHAVQILDWQPPEEIAKLMKSARAFVQHSRVAKNGDSEGTPNSILEASACGLPIISTFHAGIKEAVLPGVTGYLVEEGDWNTMGDYMIELLENPEIAGRMGSAARDHISENYSLNSQINKLNELLDVVSSKSK
jgi:glycosyltransferase involved in cell wall biosynthesis